MLKEVKDYEANNHVDEESNPIYINWIKSIFGREAIDWYVTI